MTFGKQRVQDAGREGGGERSRGLRGALGSAPGSGSSQAGEGAAWGWREKQQKAADSGRGLTGGWEQLVFPAAEARLP